MDTLNAWTKMKSETNRIEYKQQLTDELEKEAVAFLNYHEGGVLYIGIDKEGQPVGVTYLLKFPTPRNPCKI